MYEYRGLTRANIVGGKKKFERQPGQGVTFVSGRRALEGNPLNRAVNRCPPSLPLPRPNCHVPAILLFAHSSLSGGGGEKSVIFANFVRQQFRVDDLILNQRPKPGRRDIYLPTAARADCRCLGTAT